MILQFFTFFIDASAATITILNENYDGQSLDESVQANLTRVRNWEKAFVEFMQVFKLNLTKEKKTLMFKEGQFWGRYRLRFFSSSLLGDGFQKMPPKRHF